MWKALAVACSVAIFLNVTQYAEAKIYATAAEMAADCLALDECAAAFDATTAAADIQNRNFLPAVLAASYTFPYDATARILAASASNDTLAALLIAADQSAQPIRCSGDEQAYIDAGTGIKACRCRPGINCRNACNRSSYAPILYFVAGLAATSAALLVYLAARVSGKNKEA